MSLATLRSETVRPRAAAQGAVAPHRIRTRLGIAIGLALIIAIFAARCWPSARWDSITADETTHLVHVLNLLHNGDDLAMWELGAPRLPHVLGGMASYAALRDAHIIPDAMDTEAITALVLSGRPRVLVPARLVAIAWGGLLIGLVFWAVARDRGAVPGLIAAGLTSMVPECLAHSAIAASDMPFTASAFLSILCLVRYVEQPSAKRWLGVALAIGLAWAMRHTALVLLMLASVVHLVVTIRNRKERGFASMAEAFASSGLSAVALGLISFAVLWAGDGLETVALSEVAGRASGGLPMRLGPIDVARLPVPTSALSVIKQVRHQNAGHESYLCGEVSQSGWASYFPIAFLMKTPTGLIALLILAAARAKMRKPSAWDAIALACLALLWIMLVRNKVNIGVRYALLTYPLAITFVVRMFEPRALRDRVWTPVVIVATAWFLITSISAHPKYLSSFNEIGGGPKSGWLYLADSNIDWGQDFDALANTLVRLQIREVTTDISTERRMQILGIYATPNPSKQFQSPDVTPPNRRLYDSNGGYLPVYTRYVAVSVSRLLGLYSQNDMSWLRTRKLVERVGDSTFLFDMDMPAHRPLF